MVTVGTLWLKRINFGQYAAHSFAGQTISYKLKINLNFNIKIKKANITKTI